MKRIILRIFAILLCSAVTYSLMMITPSLFIQPARGIAYILRCIGSSQALIFHGRIFMVELSWGLSCFIGGLLIGLWCKYRGWFYGLMVVLCSYAVRGLLMVQMGPVLETLKESLVEKGFYTGRIVVSMIIFSLSIVCGVIGGKLGVRIRTKPLNRTVSS